MKRSAGDAQLKAPATTTKEKEKVPAIRLEDLDLCNDVTVLPDPVQKDFFSLRRDSLPVFVEMSLEGYIPPKFGVKEYSMGDVAKNTDKIILKANVENKQTQQQLLRLSQQCADFIKKTGAEVVCEG